MPNEPIDSNVSMWINDKIWTGFRLRDPLHQEPIAAIFKYGWLSQARALGRKVSGSTLIMLSFLNEQGQSMFLSNLAEEKLVLETFVPSMYDIQHALPLMGVIPKAISNSVLDLTTADPAIQRFQLELLDRRDAENPSRDYLFDLSSEDKAELAKLRATDN